MFKNDLTARLAHVHFVDLPTGEPNPDTAPGSGGGTPAPTTPPAGGNSGKTFTQEELDAIISERLERDRKAREAEAKQKAEREKMDAEQRAQAEKKEAEERAAAAEARALAAERRAALAGHVVDPAAAIKLLDPEKHLDRDGNVVVEKLLKDFPFLAPQQQPKGPSAPGAGGTHPANPGNPLDSWAAADAADRTRR